MKQKTFLKLIYKVHSKQLRKSKWDLNLPLDLAMSKFPDNIVSIGDSQVLRFIDELNGVTDVSDKVTNIKRKIKIEKCKPKSSETKTKIKELYNALYGLQFQKDYVCVIMDRNSDYERANKGFKINGITYRRFLGTNGGIKNSTIVYVNADLYPELKRRLDNGRNMNKELVPAKLEAYQALICSGSTPLPHPNGIIVVQDCITHFKDDVILIDDSGDGEPVLTYEDRYEIEHNNSDGFGLMLPSYSRRVNEYLNGDGEHALSGMNTRCAWTKGMVYTFDYVDFAEKVAGTYEVIDAWGDKRDVRDAEVILTVSMLKLWDSYDSWEDYWHNCQINHYEFATPKVTPDELENVRNTNYQFLQSYDFTDEELNELCQPTIDEIKEVLGMDYRKSLVFLAGYGLDEENVKYIDDNVVKALMIEPEMINDPFIRKRIHSMILKRIEQAKTGSIQVNANFAMISGDPYALCQSMFGLEITGLLQAGELYHKYWIDKGAMELACFRAPMTAHNNIRKLKLRNDEQTGYWFRYIRTAIILNAWDTTCEAENGADFDGDTFFTTDNPVILRETRNDRTIVCVQRKAKKVVPTEEDIIQSNKLAFNDEIGIVTNHITSMIERLAGLNPIEDEREYQTLLYRIMCGQLYQQNVIDRAKGIIAKSMPTKWYDVRENRIHEEDDEYVTTNKLFQQRICANKKPYFMIYIYPKLRKELNDWQKKNNANVIQRFCKYGILSISDLIECDHKNKDMNDFLLFYKKGLPVGTNPCTINRICWMFEREFDGFIPKIKKRNQFDYTILKSDREYSQDDYEEVSKIYSEYRNMIRAFQKKSHTEKLDKEDRELERQKIIGIFKSKCEQICPDSKELCDIILDICYNSENSKQFAWDICGDTIIENLLQRNNFAFYFPQMCQCTGEFQYMGLDFNMRKMVIKDNED